jgi:hypothetical protein
MVAAREGNSIATACGENGVSGERVNGSRGVPSRDREQMEPSKSNHVCLDRDFHNTTPSIFSYPESSGMCHIVTLGCDCSMLNYAGFEKESSPIRTEMRLPRNKLL